MSIYLWMPLCEGRRIFAIKGEPVKRASFSCGYERPVEYRDEFGVPVLVEEKLEEKS